MRLWYDTPAKNWNEALPIGNGSLGAMVHGHVEEEILNLNEETLWYRGASDRNNPDSLNYLDEIRELLLEEKITEAEELVRQAMFATPRDQSHYEALGELYLTHNNIDINDIISYERELDIEKAIASVKYRTKTTRYSREIFISKKLNMLVMNFEADGEDKIDFEVRIERKKRFSDSVTQLPSKDGVVMGGTVGGKNGVEFRAVAKVGSYTGEQVKVIGETIVGKNINSITFFVAVSTDYRGNEFLFDYKNNIKKVTVQSYEKICQEHIDDYKGLNNRMEIQLYGPDKSQYPTDVRLKKFKESPLDDIGLINLYFNYGKYLLISSSRPGGLPSTLQGIWNEDLNPIWGSKYTININIQMNYWLTGPCNLSELQNPLLDLIENMQLNGQITAKKMYGARGFTAHHNTDGFFDTAPQSRAIGAAIWPMTVPWLCTHIWEQYLFEDNKKILEKYYPIYLRAVEFYEDYLFETLDGQLVTGPSVSPENKYRTSKGIEGNICLGPTIDLQILRYFFKSFLKISKLLNKNEKNEKVSTMIKKLPETKIGKYGQIQEWLKDYDEVEPGHRHISQLFGLYPGDEINVYNTPQLAEAARRTIERRKKYSNELDSENREGTISNWLDVGHGGSHRTGWSVAWLINFFARLKMGNDGLEELIHLLSYSTLDNLLDDHPPFQIDGNFGAVAGICELLMQSHNDFIEILPALPTKFKGGKVKNLRARGNILVSFEWEYNKIKKLSVISQKDKIIKIKLDSHLLEEKIDNIIEVNLKANKQIDIF
ncbi:glycoside hydrolase family 95 protein [Dolosigranulum pigrum]|uniref:glycoside hydrolase family 95 protein n=2 Tax=Dolosigranulum pigrum TaxID=29394 RepID=UPI000DC4F235|nr:glycoside hydrolase family 95 protein [Dolosigranulum pigrum]RAN51017.1 hypothetical protein B8A31_07090 [Dolosigranulum pigrum]